MQAADFKNDSKLGRSFPLPEDGSRLKCLAFCLQEIATSWGNGGRSLAQPGMGVTAFAWRDSVAVLGSTHRWLLHKMTQTLLPESLDCNDRNRRGATHADPIHNSQPRRNLGGQERKAMETRGQTAGRCSRPLGGRLPNPIKLANTFCVY